MTEPGDPKKKIVDQLQVAAIRRSLEAQVQQETSILKEMNEILNEVELYISKLPPIAGPEILPHERAAQTRVRELYDRFVKLVADYLYGESDVPAAKDLHSLIMARRENRGESLQKLVDLGGMHPLEQVSLIADMRERSEAL